MTMQNRIDSFGLLALLALGTACQGDPLAGPQGIRPSAFSEPGDPGAALWRLAFTGPVERRLLLLPQQGKSAEVWSGALWPMSSGGTAFRTHPDELSPMEKYDLATGQAGLATSWELGDCRRMAGISWAGHCNGLAAAGILAPEPRNPVHYRDVTFSPEDVKALLIEAHQDSGLVEGLRCELDNPVTDEHGRLIQPECRDVDPAVLHLALTHFLAAGEPIVIDVLGNRGVWNFPVVEYDVMETEELTARWATHLLTGQTDVYPYNPRAERFFRTRTKLTLANRGLVVYQYILETTADGAIIGGEWLAASKTAHPDFLWRPETEPKPANPFLDAEVISELQRQSSRSGDE